MLAIIDDDHQIPMYLDPPKYIENWARIRISLGIWVRPEFCWLAHRCPAPWCHGGPLRFQFPHWFQRPPPPPPCPQWVCSELTWDGPDGNRHVLVVASSNMVWLWWHIDEQKKGLWRSLSKHRFIEFHKYFLGDQWYHQQKNRGYGCTKHGDMGCLANLRPTLVVDDEAILHWLLGTRDLTLRKRYKKLFKMAIEIVDLPWFTY